MSGDHNAHQKAMPIAEQLTEDEIMALWKECCMRVEGSSRELVLTFAHTLLEKRNEAT